MKNYVTILLENRTNINDDLLYVFITDGNNNFYLLSESNCWVAKPQQSVCNTLYSSLPKNSDNITYFFLDANANIKGGEIWFSTSPSALSGGGSKGISQPSANATYVFDHVEFAITSGSNINVDTTSVDQLGIPITMLINPVIAKKSTLLDLAMGQCFPSVIGTTPGLGMQAIADNFCKYTSTAPLSPFSNCLQKFTDNEKSTSRLLAPVHLINNYKPGASTDALSTVMDNAIYELFKFYSQSSNTLIFQDPVTGNQYHGNVVTLKDKNGHTYTVFQFTGPLVSFDGRSSSVFNIYYPFFNTNCSSAPNNNEFIFDGLPPVPSCWNSTMPLNMPPTAMLLACAGVFGDAASQFPPPPSPGQPANALQALQGNLENQLVSLLNRGLNPNTGNLIGFNLPAYSANQIGPPDLKNLVSFSDTEPNKHVANTGAYGIYTLPMSNNCIYFGATISGTVQLSDGSKQNFALVNGKCDVDDYNGNSTKLNSVQQFNSSNNQLQLLYDSAVSPLPVLTSITYSYASLLNNQFALINEISPFPDGLVEGMQVVNQHTQPANIYYVDCDTKTIIIQSTNNNNLVAELSQWIISGNFYPMKETGPIGIWNAYSGFLHNGNNKLTPPLSAPFISQLGYGYAYDDQGGYSNDLTVNFDSDNSATIGILLNQVLATPSS